MFIKLKRFISISFLMGMVSISSILPVYAINNQLDPMSYDIPVVDSRYTNRAPSWRWQTLYQINVEDLEGNIIYSESIGDVNQFTLQEKLVHGKSFKA